jgi:hypothetical protein
MCLNNSNILKTCIQANEELNIVLVLNFFVELWVLPPIPPEGG